MPDIKRTVYAISKTPKEKEDIVKPLKQVANSGKIEQYREPYLKLSEANQLEANKHEPYATFLKWREALSWLK